jgi:hypothetical protein
MMLVNKVSPHFSVRRVLGFSQCVYDALSRDSVGWCKRMRLRPCYILFTFRSLSLVITQFDLYQSVTTTP